MTNEEIKAIGYFLSSYESDLNYIRNFQRFKFGRITIPDYASENNRRYFPKFLSEFRIARNRIQGADTEILELTHDWIHGNNPNDVDGFALNLYVNDMTHGLATSFASKVLMLNNPCSIFPIDGNVRKKLGLNNNSYSEYIELLTTYRENYNREINNCLSYVTPLAIRIENDFGDIPYKHRIRKCRLIDKLLWSI
jgi:hypothetical protein